MTAIHGKTELQRISECLGTDARSALAHHYNNGLAVVISNALWLLGEDINPEVREAVEDILHMGQRMVEVTDTVTAKDDRLAGIAA